MGEIDYYFSIIVRENGEQFPWIKIHNDDEFQLIERIGVTDLSKSKNVLTIVNRLKAVSEIDHIYHDNIEMHITPSKTTLVRDVVDAPRCILETSKFIEIMEGWYNFLRKYERNKIPGIDRNFDNTEVGK